VETFNTTNVMTIEESRECAYQVVSSAALAGLGRNQVGETVQKNQLLLKLEMKPWSEKFGKLEVLRIKEIMLLLCLSILKLF
jgi:hypothetical protein